MNPSELPTGKPSPSSSNKLPLSRQQNSLRVRKESHKIIKNAPSSSSSSSSSSSQPPPPATHHHHQPPRVIYNVAPRIIHVTPDNFKDLVQRLTGKPPDNEQETGTSSVSLAARFASIEGTIPKNKERVSCSSRDEDMMKKMQEDGVQIGPFPGILSSEPSALPPISSENFRHAALQPIPSVNISQSQVTMSPIFSENFSPVAYPPTPSNIFSPVTFPTMPPIPSDYIPQVSMPPPSEYFPQVSMPLMQSPYFPPVMQSQYYPPVSMPLMQSEYYPGITSTRPSGFFLPGNIQSEFSSQNTSPWMPFQEFPPPVIDPQSQTVLSYNDIWPENSIAASSSDIPPADVVPPQTPPNMFGPFDSK
ncbi:hypothetical protein TSUD_318900 [Trifolium subterraneum]|uniref:VQ domain-containing protein n=1 Tax=Trifolium subterraneum TaxID=3900 RepID=A0A2Z6N2C1_TRISU|nr:hypothetical protein TSUD_318900 [Trifolium subterraneum]